MKNEEREKKKHYFDHPWSGGQCCRHWCGFVELDPVGRGLSPKQPWRKMSWRRLKNKMLSKYWFIPKLTLNSWSQKPNKWVITTQMHRIILRLLFLSKVHHKDSTIYIYKIRLYEYLKKNPLFSTPPTLLGSLPLGGLRFRPGSGSGRHEKDLRFHTVLRCAAAGRRGWAHGPN